MRDQPTPEQTPERGCLAEEWQRDGRGFWAKRACRLGPKHKDKHDFWRWEFYAKPPHEIRAEAAEAQVAALTATLAHLTQERNELQAARDELWTHWNTRDQACREAEATLARVKAQEQCICAAIRLKNGEVWRGHRHDSAILTAQRAPDVDLDGHEQGFITSLNRFVGREEGARIQRAAGIPSAHTLQPVNDLLFSEDLYLRDWRSDAALVDPPVSSSTTEKT